MAAVAQYITIVDRSNKVVGTSKQLKNVFKEAKIAYLERKAEIAAERKRKEDVELQKAIRAVSIQDETERGSQYSGVGRSGTRRREHHGRRNGSISPQEADNFEHRPRSHRHHSYASTRSGHSSPGSESPRSPSGHIPLGEFNAQLDATRHLSQPHSPVDAPQQGLVRARTDLDVTQRRPSQLGRSHSYDDIDMDLAYGEFHPTDLAVQPPEQQQQKELSTLVTKCKFLLDEANCAQHSAKAIIAHLQKNPDAMAAVALTLAEISNVVSKMAPGALATLGKTAPAVMALLASPEFLVAVGVGVGVTVIAFGGYKIVKKIKQKMGDKEGEEGMDEALDVKELDRIEHWRRGIADAHVDETGSVVSYATGTSVEGEFISPYAAASMGHLPPRSKSGKSKKEKKHKDKDGSERKKKHRHRRNSDGDEAESEVSRGSRASGISRSATERLTVDGNDRDRALIKVKKPSPLRRMFTTGSSVRS